MESDQEFLPSKSCYVCSQVTISKSKSSTGRLSGVRGPTRIWCFVCSILGSKFMGPVGLVARPGRSHEIHSSQTPWARASTGVGLQKPSQDSHPLQFQNRNATSSGGRKLEKAKCSAKMEGVAVVFSNFDVR